MPVELKMTYTGLSEVTKAVKDLPGKFARAKKSAMGSVGWYVMGALRNHVEYGPPEWQGFHPLTAKFWKGRGVGGPWVKRRTPPFSPVGWLGKFARYRRSKSGDTVQIDFGKGRKGGTNPGMNDPQLAAIARRIDQGDKVAVTEKMRKRWGATKKRAGKDPQIGVDYFPLRKSTKYIEMPARPIFGPVFRKVQPVVTDIFEKKFWDSYYGVRNK